ncbi:hypothetical protein ALC56_07035 [Trachymyrmex septentrionalis]|uniref:Uncharacterized protein n=1 Tax=Trachymyrmex septentrionalis TaxID=34720 RepID=A0A195FEC1_9HYME|nr:hypothetical protein ALC56_07035 [Trachymyrmex septentrionalis]
MHTRSGCMRIPRGTRIRPKHMRDLPKLSSLEIYQRTQCNSAQDCQVSRVDQLLLSIASNENRIISGLPQI